MQGIYVDSGRPDAVARRPDPNHLKLSETFRNPLLHSVSRATISTIATIARCNFSNRSNLSASPTARLGTGDAPSDGVDRKGSNRNGLKWIEMDNKKDLGFGH